jgi:hypothetical protein
MNPREGDHCGLEKLRESGRKTLCKGLWDTSEACTTKIAAIFLGWIIGLPKSTWEVSCKESHLVIGEVFTYRFCMFEAYANSQRSSAPNLNRAK